MRNRISIFGLLMATILLVGLVGQGRTDSKSVAGDADSAKPLIKSEMDLFLEKVELTQLAAEELASAGITSNGGRTFEVPADAVVHRYSYSNGQQTYEWSSEMSRGTPEVVYSNTSSSDAYSAGQFAFIADDMRTTASCGCDLESFTFRVAGGGDGTGSFQVLVDLFEECPVTGVDPIPGTNGFFNVSDDSGVTDLVVNLAAPIEVPRTLWMRVAFDTAEAGWLRGSAPEIGVSEDLYFNPFAGCNTTFLNSYASFYAQLSCEPITGPDPASDPVPADGANNVDADTDLAWNGASASRDAPGTMDDKEFVDGTLHPDEFTRRWEQALRTGEVKDPRDEFRLPFPPGDPEVRRGGSVAPTVTREDIFVYEDTADMLFNGFNFGDLIGLFDDAAQDIIAEYGDKFDFVAFWTTFNVDPGSQFGAAFYSSIANDTTGLGLGLFDNRGSHGLAGTKVLGYVMMYNIYSWSVGGASTRLVLGQEFEHRWALFLNDLPGGRSLQGNDGSCGRSSHWNFNVDGQASGMEIREWIGSSPATRVSGTLNYNTDIGGTAVFSYPDLYLMGYVSPEEMDTLSSELRFMGNSDSDNPGCANNYNGPISHWTAADVVATNGTRVPSSLSSQKDFRTAWVLFHRPGTPPTNGDLDRTVNHLNDWSDTYAHSVLNRGIMDNTLRGEACSEKYDVKFDTFSPPTTIICEETFSLTCDPGPLVCGQTYFWQVDTEHESGTATSPIWSFTVGGTEDCNNNSTPDACEIADGSAEDCNGNGVPDECDIGSGTSEDCNGDQVPDECNISSGSSQDCNTNNIPDECDVAGGGGSNDCNGNQIPDECEPTDCQPNGVPDDCDISSGTSEDCQPNGVPDECDIAAGTSIDANSNGIPDECDGFAIESPIAAASPHDGTKNRYISINPNNEDNLAAFEVTLLGPDTVVAWVGEPFLLDDRTTNPQWVADLVLSPAGDGSDLLRDWSVFTDPDTGENVVHIRGCAVFPDQSYEIRARGTTPSLSDPNVFSTTPDPGLAGSWADCVGVFAAGAWTGPNDATNFNDIAATIDQFQQKETNPVTWTDVAEEIPNYITNFTDIGAVISGFQENDYWDSVPDHDSVLDCVTPMP